MSRELERKIQGCWLYDRYISNVEGFGKSDNILAVDLQDIISKDISNCIYKVSMSEYTTIVSRKLEVLNQQHVLIFTDGSVVGGTIGCGACSWFCFLQMEERIMFTLQLEQLELKSAVSSVKLKVSFLAQKLL